MTDDENILVHRLLGLFDLSSDVGIDIPHQWAHLQRARLRLHLDTVLAVQSLETFVVEFEKQFQESHHRHTLGGRMLDEDTANAFLRDDQLLGEKQTTTKDVITFEQ